jgi:predicted lipoprotein with Yx(FWY)xxD motif
MPAPIAKGIPVRALTVLLLTAAICVATGCGDEETPRGGGASNQGAADRSGDATPSGEDRAAGERMDTRKRGRGTRLTLRDSQFGTMLFDSRRQAIYIFELDRNRETVCYGECAEAWPPVVTKGKPVAGSGVKSQLLGTIERRDGTRQVTYAGRPLYYYAHESAGEVRCHNVNLNGGFWWVVGPDGKRRA